MEFLKNKHMILAMFVAPVLAILAYYAVDYSVSEKPHVAKQGNSYKLMASSNCRYQSGFCTLKNGDIEVNLRAQHLSENAVQLTLSSDMPIEQVLISFVDEKSATKPELMKTTTDDGKIWQTQIADISAEQSALRLALRIAGTTYFAETTAVFIDYKTSFSRDNFSK